ncbi:hypothetical protein [Streptomyces sp. A012304]|uniref:hypothetical protein n=1 Tax=Streptomyces sp. A012304 TaxID=375446 RepID=UPI00222E8C23|nr:hypothetical protein [Streptomyces sp. A012304]GKQ37169.1 hypothetical protein ALMP_37080 [Streptomyces sp. A012304]
MSNSRRRTTGNRFGLLATPHPADIAAEHAEALDTLDFDKLIAAVPDAVDTAMQQAIPHRYNPTIAASIAADITARLCKARQGDAYECPVWPGLCVETEPGHYDHHNHRNFVTDKRGERMLDIGFIQFSDEEGAAPPKICISGMGSEDYDPSEVREKTAEIRRMLDEADAIADRIIAQRRDGA